MQTLIISIIVSILTSVITSKIVQRRLKHNYNKQIDKMEETLMWTRIRYNNQLVAIRSQLEQLGIDVDGRYKDEEIFEKEIFKR